MKIKLGLLLVTAVLISNSGQLQGAAAEQLLSVSVSGYGNGPLRTNGPITSASVFRFRVTTKDVIAEISEGASLNYVPGSQLVRRTDNFGETNQTHSILLRRKNYPDVDVSDFFVMNNSTNYVNSYVFDSNKGNWNRYTYHNISDIEFYGAEGTGLFIRGLLNEAGRTYSTRTSNGSLVKGELATSAAKVSGEIFDGGEFVGPVEGTFSISAPRFSR